MGYLTNIQYQAKKYVEENEAQLIPFGGDHPIIIEAMKNVASLDIEPPKEVWTVMSSGVLSRGLQLEVYGVRIGHNTTLRERGNSETFISNINSIKNVKNQKDPHFQVHLLMIVKCGNL